MELYDYIWWIYGYMEFCLILFLELLAGCVNHLEKYEFVNGKDDIPYMKWKINNVWNHQPDWLYGMMFYTIWRPSGHQAWLEKKTSHSSMIFRTKPPLLMGFHCWACLNEEVVLCGFMRDSGWAYMVLYGPIGSLFWVKINHSLGYPCPG